MEALDKKKKWKFVPSIRKGTEVVTGDILGVVQETAIVEHRIICPNGVSGVVSEIAEGDFTILEPVYSIKSGSGVSRSFPMMQKWEVRRPRPFREKLEPNILLVTGQRVIDAFFPIARGGTACIPGPFGSGKTVTQQQLAKWADANIIVYVGCGERGNEMTEVLTTFPQARRSQDQAAAYGKNHFDCQYFQHAGGCERGEYLHRNYDRGILQGHGICRSLDGR